MFLRNPMQELIIRAHYLKFDVYTLLAVPHRYKLFVQQQGLQISGDPSWEQLPIPESRYSPAEIAKLLANQGITILEANDCVEHAFH